MESQGPRSKAHAPNSPCSQALAAGWVAPRPRPPPRRPPDTPPGLPPPPPSVHLARLGSSQVSAVTAFSSLITSQRS